MSVPNMYGQAAPPVGDGDEYELASVYELLYDPAHDARIIDWRLLVFLSLGFTEAVASALAVRRDVCRQRVADLLAAGATTTQVQGILL